MEIFNDEPSLKLLWDVWSSNIMATVRKEKQQQASVAFFTGAVSLYLFVSPRRKCHPQIVDTDFPTTKDFLHGGGV